MLLYHYVLVRWRWDTGRRIRGAEKFDDGNYGVDARDHWQEADPAEDEGTKLDIGGADDDEDYDYDAYHSQCSDHWEAVYGNG